MNTIEVNMDNHTQHEADIVCKMLKVAEKHGLLVEVVLSYGYACRNHRPLELSEYEDCAEEALNEWDI